MIVLVAVTVVESEYDRCLSQFKKLTLEGSIVGILKDRFMYYELNPEDTTKILDILDSRYEDNSRKWVVRLFTSKGDWVGGRIIK